MWSWFHSTIIIDFDPKINLFTKLQPINYFISVWAYFTEQYEVKIVFFIAVFYLNCSCQGNYIKQIKSYTLCSALLLLPFIHMQCSRCVSLKQNWNWNIFGILLGPNSMAKRVTATVHTNVCSQKCWFIYLPHLSPQIFRYWYFMILYYN